MGFVGRMKNECRPKLVDWSTVFLLAQCFDQKCRCLTGWINRTLIILLFQTVDDFKGDKSKFGLGKMFMCDQGGMECELVRFVRMIC